MGKRFLLPPPGSWELGHSTLSQAEADVTLAHQRKILVEPRPSEKR